MTHPTRVFQTSGPLVDHEVHLKCYKRIPKRVKQKIQQSHRKVIPSWNFDFCFTYTANLAMSHTRLSVSCGLESLKAADLDSVQQTSPLNPPSSGLQNSSIGIYGLEASFVPLTMNDNPIM